MKKAKFIGKSDDFFKCGKEYEISASQIGEYCGKKVIWVKFSRDFPVKLKTLFGKPIEECLCGTCICPYCRTYRSELGGTLMKKKTRTIPYESLESFLENWEVIYD